MSLRAFHLVFIAMTVVLTAFFGMWAFGEYRVNHQPAYAVTACGSLLAGAGLVIYGAAFQRKTRRL